jgi:hypothetical protein
MCRVLLLIILCAVLVGCAPAAAQTPAWSEEEAAYWLAVDNMIAFPLLIYSEPEPRLLSEDFTSLALRDAPPRLAVLRELAHASYMDCSLPWRISHCVDALRAVRLELARIVEERGSYPAGYVQTESP